MRNVIIALLLLLNGHPAWGFLNQDMMLGVGSGVASGLQAPGPSAALFASPPYSCATNRYIATAANGGSDSADGTAPTVGGGHGPWLTWAHADAAVPSAGWCVTFGVGEYDLAGDVTLSHGGNTSSPTGYVVYRCAVLVTTPGTGCHIKEVTNGTNRMITINAGVHYLMFDALEFDGNCAPASNTGVNTCVSGSFGTAMSTDHFTVPCTLGTTCPHHQWVINCIIHDYGLSGLQFGDSEWHWMLHNSIYRNAYSDQSGSYGSGISIYEPFVVSPYTPTAMDTQWSPYTIVMAYNVVHDNFNCTACGGGETDGNGIIFDDWRHTQNTPNTVFAHKGLAFGNAVYHNGGRGVHVFLTAHADVVNNTGYNNNWSALNLPGWRADINIEGSDNVLVRNNIGFTVKTQTANSPFVGHQDSPPDTNDNNTWAHNIGWGAVADMADGNTFPTPSNLNNTSNPNLVAVGTNNFALQGTSPAIGFGDSATYGPYTATVDAGACVSGLTQCP